VASCLGQVWHGDDHGRDFGTARFEMWLENRFLEEICLPGSVVWGKKDFGGFRLLTACMLSEAGGSHRSPSAAHPILKIPRF
jgi:hypothetical protein